MTRPIIFLDLDDTLFSSMRKQDTDDSSSLTVAAVDREQRPLSFMNEKQLAFWQWLQHNEAPSPEANGAKTNGPSANGTRLIPLTARTTRSYARVKLPFNDFVICSSGAVILGPDGVIDEAWRETILAKSDADRDAYQKVEEIVKAEGELMRMQLGVIREYGRGLFFSLRRPDKNFGAVSELRQRLSPLLPDGWTARLSNHDLTVLPKFIAKGVAMSWFLESRVDEVSFTIGVGDSLFDLDFLELCDYAMGPRQCQWWTQRMTNGIE